MANDKSLFKALGVLAEAISKLNIEKEDCEADKNNAEICKIVEKMMRRKDLDDDEIDAIINRLDPIYSSDYRHSYSNISSTIVSVNNEVENETPGRTEEVLSVLVDNTAKLYNGAKRRYRCKPQDEEYNTKSTILIKYQKLYDHINLDAVRQIEYEKQIGRALDVMRGASDITKKEIETLTVATKKDIEVANTTTQKEIAEFNSKIEKTEAKIDKKIAEDLTKMEQKTQKMQAEYISILGIFASIVLAFIGGMTFSTSVLNNIHNGSIYRLLIITALIGMVFIAMIWLLMDFVKTIHGEHKRNYWYIIIPEVVLIVIMASSCIAYRVSWFDGEEKITNLKSQQIEQEMSSGNDVSSNDNVE